MIVRKWDSICSDTKILLTTEKDAVRLQQMQIPEEMAKNSHYIPIEIFFL